MSKRERMVWAWGENGRELVPESEVVVIPAVYQVEHPAFPNSTPMVPATGRGFFRNAPEDWPVELLRIDPPGRDLGNGHVTPWPSIRYRTRKGRESACYVRHEADARDPWFRGMPEADRDTILAAVIVKQ